MDDRPKAPHNAGKRRRNAERLQGNAERLRAYRERLGLTQKDLAELVNVTTTTISRWESGRVSIQTPTPLWFMLDKIEEEKRVHL